MKTHEFSQKDACAIAFDVPKNDEITVRYRVR